MGAPSLLFDEAAGLDALRQFVRSVLPQVAAVDVYRVRPSAVPGKWALSVLLAPVTPLPVLQSRTGEEVDSAQVQSWLVTVTAAAAGDWALQVLGEAAVPYVAGVGPTLTEIRDGLLAGVQALGLPVTAAASGAASMTITGDVAGVSLVVRAAEVPAGGAMSFTVVDDNIRRAVVNWGVWTVRAIVRDIDPAGGAGAPQVGPCAELLRLSMQASSIPVTSGLAYPYLRDRLQEARMSWRQTLGPFNADVQDGNLWVRGCALDFAFDVPCVLLHDVPSLDAIGLQATGGVVVGPVLG